MSEQMDGRNIRKRRCECTREELNERAHDMLCNIFDIKGPWLSSSVSYML